MFKEGVYQRLGVTFKCWLTLKSWSTPEKNVLPPKKLISTSDQHAEHLFAGRNTQQ